MFLYVATSELPGTARDNAQAAKSLGIFGLSSDMMTLSFLIIWPKKLKAAQIRQLNSSGGGKTNLNVRAKVSNMQ